MVALFILNYYSSVRLTAASSIFHRLSYQRRYIKLSNTKPKIQKQLAEHTIKSLIKSYNLTTGRNTTKPKLSGHYYSFDEINFCVSSHNETANVYTISRLYQFDQKNRTYMKICFTQQMLYRVF